MAGETLTKEEGDEYTTYLLLKLGALYKKHNVVMQMHYSWPAQCQRQDVPQARPRHRL